MKISVRGSKSDSRDAYPPAEEGAGERKEEADHHQSQMVAK